MKEITYLPSSDREDDSSWQIFDNGDCLRFYTSASFVQQEFTGLSLNDEGIEKLEGIIAEWRRNKRFSKTNQSSPITNK